MPKPSPELVQHFADSECYFLVTEKNLRGEEDFSLFIDGITPDMLVPLSQSMTIVVGAMVDHVAQQIDGLREWVERMTDTLNKTKETEVQDAQNTDAGDGTLAVASPDGAPDVGADDEHAGDVPLDGPDDG